MDSNSNTASHYAAGYGSKSALSKLLEYKPDTTLKNKDGNTPYDVAKLNKKEDILALLE
jgi:ankyrin repeat protein